MTSEEFAKWFVKPGGVYPVQVLDATGRELISSTFTLAEDYLALQENHKNAKTVLGNIRRALDTQEGCSLTDRAEAVMSELRALREKMKKQPAPVEWEEAVVPQNFIRLIREENLRTICPNLRLSDPPNPECAYVVRWPKEPK